MRAPEDAAVVLCEGLAQLEIMPAERAQDLLGKYIAEVERWNPRFGLVKYDGRIYYVNRSQIEALQSYVRWNRRKKITVIEE